MNSNSFKKLTIIACVAAPVLAFAPSSFAQSTGSTADAAIPGGGSVQIGALSSPQTWSFSQLERALRLNPKTTSLAKLNAAINRYLSKNPGSAGSMMTALLSFGGKTVASNTTSVIGQVITTTAAANSNYLPQVVVSVGSSTNGSSLLLNTVTAAVQAGPVGQSPQIAGAATSTIPSLQQQIVQTTINALSPSNQTQYTQQIQIAATIGATNPGTGNSITGGSTIL